MVSLNFPGSSQPIFGQSELKKMGELADCLASQAAAQLRMIEERLQQRRRAAEDCDDVLLDMRVEAVQALEQARSRWQDTHYWLSQLSPGKDS